MVDSTYRNGKQDFSRPFLCLMLRLEYVQEALVPDECSTGYPLVVFQSPLLCCQREELNLNIAKVEEYSQGPTGAATVREKVNLPQREHTR